MKACLICGCTNDEGCDLGDSGETCSWVEHEPPVCSRCADNIEALLNRIASAPCTVAQLFEPLPVEAHEEAARVVTLGIEHGALEYEGDLLRVTAACAAEAEAEAPPMAFVGMVEGCEVWSPGTIAIALTDSGRVTLRDLAAHLLVMAACCDTPELLEAGKRTESAAKLIALLADGETELVVGAMPHGAGVAASGGGRPS